MMVVYSRLLIWRRALRLVAVGSALSAVALAMQAPAAALDVAAGVTTRISVSQAGEQANSHSGGRAISADGRYVAFGSSATNLVPGDTNDSPDIFVRDRQTGTTHRVSVSSSAAQGVCCQGSSAPAMSPDGRYVAFTSGAPNLVPGDTNDNYDVFVRDRLARTTRRISVSSAGAQGNAASQMFASTISANGRYIAFGSNATNLVSGDTNGRGDIFLRDVQTGTTRRINLSSTGAQANHHSGSHAISADGRYVAFESSATNLVRGDTNNRTDVFLRDVQTGTTRRVSVSGAGAQANNTSADTAISADGRYVTFHSFATNLTAGDTNSDGDVYLRDWQGGVTRRISVSGTGAQATGFSVSPQISPDGRYVTFESNAPNLVPGDTNATIDAFVRDWQAGTTRRVSVSSAGQQGNSASGDTAISTGGRYVIFGSFATNLVPGDTNESIDIFVRAS